jgi:hypothetical protein
VKTFLLLAAVVAVIALLVVGLPGCAVVLESGCSTARSTEIVRTNGLPETTITRSARVCGDHPPPVPEPPQAKPRGSVV